MKSRLESITSVKGVEIDPESSQQIEAVIAERRSEMESLPTTDFKRIFWDQQVIVYASFWLISLLIFITFVGCRNEGH